MLTYAIVPARSGSKGLPNKNILPLNNLPLISYSISFAKTIKYVDKIICSTDSKKYASISQSLGAEAPFLRSKEASQDNSKMSKNSKKKVSIHQNDMI